MKIENYNVETSLYGQRREIKGDSNLSTAESFTAEFLTYNEKIVYYPYAVFNDIGIRLVKT